MPDVKTTFSAQDDLSPVLRQISDTFRAMGVTGANVGREISQAMGQLGKGGWSFADPQMAQALQSYRTQVQGFTGDLEKLFQAAGGAKTVFTGAFQKEFAQFMRDPVKKAAEGFSAEAMAGAKFAVGQLEAEKELQEAIRTNRKELEGIVIAQEEINALAQREQEIREFIAKGPTGQAGALAAGQRAMQENLKAVKEGGLVGGPREEGAIGGFVKRIGQDVAWGAESFLRYMIVWKTLDAVIQQVGQTLQAAPQMFLTMGGSVREGASALAEFNVTALLTGQSIQKLTQDMAALKAVGFTRQEAEAGAQVGAFIQRLSGVDMAPLVAKAAVYQASLKDIMMASQAGGPFQGMRGVAQEAQRLDALEPIWKAYHQRHSTLEARDLEDRQRGMQQYLEDEHTRQSDNMEDQHRAIQEQMEAQHVALSRYEEDRQEGIKNEMEDRHYNINREMEERHIAISQAMEDEQYLENRRLEASHRIANEERADRHRVAEEAASDEERLYSRRESFLESVPGAMDALAQMYGQHIKGKIAPIGRHAAAYLVGEMNKGFAEMQKEGIDPRFAKEAIREGMSPGVVLKFAEAAREDERIARRRGEEKEDRNAERKEKQEDLANEDRHHKESITMQRQFQKESRAEAEAQHAESIRVERGLHLEAKTMNRLLQDQQRAAALLIAHEEIDQRRKFRQEDLSMQRASHLEALTMERTAQDEEMDFEFRILEIKMQGNEMMIAAFRTAMNTMMPVITTFYNMMALPLGLPTMQWKPLEKTKEETDIQKQMHGLMDGMRSDIEKQHHQTDTSTKTLKDKTDADLEQLKTQGDAGASTEVLRRKFDEASKAVNNFAQRLEGGGALPETAPATGVAGEKVMVRGSQGEPLWGLNQPGMGAQTMLELPAPRKGESKAEYAAELIITMMKIITAVEVDSNRILTKVFTVS